ncbi:MAG: MFS transporter [Bryobacteraceae bacterium]|nr:MFS transporter [Bryobacteraceae bacterium]
MARYRFLLLGFFMSVITYLDRVAISVAAPGISRDLRLSTEQMGYVFAVFALAYAIFEIPAGWLGDRIGQRKVLTRIVACWSVLTMLTGAVRGLWSLLAVRFVFGAAEAGAFPNLARAFARWFPRGERARANGVMWMGARIGGALAPPLAAWLASEIGWRLMFVVFGAVGIVWCFVFWPWFRDDPATHPAVSAAELAEIQEGAVASPTPIANPWRRMFTSGNLWAIFWMYFCSAYGFYFFVTWLPTFLMRDHGLTLGKSGLYAALPLAFGAVGSLAGGALSDWLVRRTGDVKWARRSIGIAAFLLAAAGFGLATLAADPLTAVLCLALAEGFHDFSLPVSWATVVDVGGRLGGATSGFMNMASSFSAMLSSISAAWLAATFGTFNAMLAAAAVTYVIGALLWLGIDPTKPVSD